jgi:hypothetical protein
MPAPADHGLQEVVLSGTQTAKSDACPTKCRAGGSTVIVEPPARLVASYYAVDQASCRPARRPRRTRPVPAASNAAPAAASQPLVLPVSGSSG